VKKIDVDALRREVSLSDLVGAHVKLSREGDEHRGLCPFHKEKTPSFYVFPAKVGHRYRCFGCGADGDCIDWIQHHHSVDFKKAVAILGGADTPKVHAEQRESRAVDIYSDFEILRPPANAEELFKPGLKTPPLFNPKRAADEGRRFGDFKPRLVHPYRNQDGTLRGFVLRHDLSAGKETHKSNS
jgi:DNA primase